VKKSSASSVASEDTSKKSLTHFLEKGDKPRLKVGGSASVAGDQIAVSKEASLTGEVYVRADGKKVRRVKKSSASSVSGDDNNEIIVKPDGTKVRRIRKTKALEDSSSSSVVDPTTREKTASGSGLAGFLGNSPLSSKSKFSGSHSVAGDQYLEGEIYVRADGKKVRRVRKVKGSGSSLSGFLDSESTGKTKHSGAATVVGDIGRQSDPLEKPETEIYVRPDGTVGASIPRLRDSLTVLILIGFVLPSRK
jgi:ribosomal protein L24E